MDDLLSFFSIMSIGQALCFYSVSVEGTILCRLTF